jgi:hypothetical protein
MTITETTDHYREVCDRLGFIPEVRFVEILPDGSISYTAGKPDEVRALLAACERHGFKASKSLRRAAQR